MGNYVSSIFGKLQVADRAEAIIRAREDIQCHSDVVEPVHLQRIKDDLGLTAEEAAESGISPLLERFVGGYEILALARFRAYGFNES